MVSIGAQIISAGDLDRALAAIQAKTLVMPSQTDLYFTPEDCAAEAAKNLMYHSIESIVVILVNSIVN